MPESEFLGQTFKKSEHRKALIPRLLGRSDGSIEFKHQNISGVLVEIMHGATTARTAKKPKSSTGANF